MTIKFKFINTYLIMTLIFVLPLATYAVGPEEDHKEARTPRRFVGLAYLRVALELDFPILEAIYHSTPPLRHYERFLKGVLIYKPNKDSDAGKVEMRISELANPLEGTFDLSQCGDVGQYLSVSTGYRKGKKPENEAKVEIWYALRFFIEENLEGSASHFKRIMGSWDSNTAPVGTFITWGGWDNLDKYDYATQLSWEAYNENNLYYLPRAEPSRGAFRTRTEYLKDFSCHF